MINFQDYYQKKDKGLTTIVISDDGTIVAFKKNFDPETGEEKSPETYATTSKDELESEKIRLQGEINIINQFEQENNL